MLGQELTVVMTAGTAHRWPPGPCWVCSSLLTQLASCRSGGSFSGHWLLFPLGLIHRGTFKIPEQMPALFGGTQTTQCLQLSLLSQSLVWMDRELQRQTVTLCNVLKEF